MTPDPEIFFRRRISPITSGIDTAIVRMVAPGLELGFGERASGIGGADEDDGTVGRGTSGTGT
jgi:hypothetical protein